MAALTKFRILGLLAAGLFAAALPRAASAQMVGEGQPLPSEQEYGTEIVAPGTAEAPVAERMAKAVAIANKAIDRGYGQTCDLKAMPAGRGGYYPCVDIGPYRFVREYANAGTRTAGYLVAGGEPFRIIESAGRVTQLLISGPWESDLLPRATRYDEDISGVTASRERALVPETRRVDAERRLRDFQSKERSNEADTAAQGAPGQPGVPK